MKLLMTFIFTLIFSLEATAMTLIDFKHITKVDKPNTFLVCPADYCNLTPNQVAPVYSINVQALITAWQKMITHQPRVVLAETSPNKLQFQYQQSTLVFRFVDDIDVLFIPLSPTTSTLAVYSRSRVGYYDFGVNRKRITNWLSQLNKIIKS